MLLAAFQTAEEDFAALLIGRHRQCHTSFSILSLCGVVDATAAM